MPASTPSMEVVLVLTQEAVLATETGTGLFQIRVMTGHTEIIADEPVAVGGLGSGPDPFQLACASLASCTLMTMRLYARRKQWDVPLMRVSVRHEKTSVGARDRFLRTICLAPTLSADQQTSLLSIADRCPVHRMLEGGAEVATEASQDLMPPRANALHGSAMADVSLPGEEQAA